MLTLVQPVGADFVAWEAEEPNAIIRETDGDNRGWTRVTPGYTWALTPVGGDPGYPAAEGPLQALDDNTATKYLNFGGNDRPTGLIITLAADDLFSPVTSMVFNLANDTDGGDPVTYVLEGSMSATPGPNDAFVPVASGLTGVGFVGDPAFIAEGNVPYPRGLESTVNFTNDTAYRSYRLTFPNVRNSGSDRMQIADALLVAGGVQVGMASEGATAVAIHAVNSQMPTGANRNVVGYDLTQSGFDMSITPNNPSGNTVLYADDGDGGSFVTYVINFAEPGTYKLYTRRMISSQQGNDNSVGIHGSNATTGTIDQDHIFNTATRQTWDDDNIPWDTAGLPSIQKQTEAGNYIWTSDGPLGVTGFGAGMMFTIPSPGQHSITISTREAHYMLDRLVLSKNTALTAAELEALANNATSERTTPTAATLNPANAGNAGVELTWTGGVGRMFYHVKRATTPGGPYTTLTPAAGQTGTRFVDTTVTNEQTYYYIVTSTNTVGGAALESPNSNEITATPSASIPPVAVTNVTANGIGFDQVRLTWNGPIFATTYNIKRADTAGGPFVTVGTASGVGPGSFNFIDTLPAGTAPGEDFFYIVSAVSGAGVEGPNSTPEQRAVAASGLRATIYATANHTDNAANAVDPLTAFHSTVDFGFGTAAPAAGIPADNFSIRWESVFIPPVTGIYRFFEATDDGGRLYINGEQVINRWFGEGENERPTNGTYALTAGVPIHLMMESNDTGGGAGARLRYEVRDAGGAVQISKRIIPSVDLRLPAGNQAHLGWFRATDYNQVTLNWGAPSGAGPFTYDVQRADTAGGPLTTVASNISATSFVDTLPAGTATGEDFHYVVTAIVNGVPGTPTPSVMVRANAGLAGYFFNQNFWGGGPRPGSPDQSVGIRLPATHNNVFVNAVQYNWDVQAPGRQDWYANPQFTPFPGIGGDNHSTMFIGQLRANEAGNYYILGRGDDDTHVYVDGQLVSTDPNGHGIPGPDNGGIVPGGIENKVLLNFAANSVHDIMIIQAEQGGGSGVFLDWITPSNQAGVTGAPGNFTVTAIPPQNLMATSTPLTPPTGVSASVVGSKVEVTFSDTNKSEIGFMLERSVNGGAWVVVGHSPMLAGDPGVARNGTITDHGAPTNATTLQYRVVAVNPFGNSPPSAAADSSIPTLTNSGQNVNLYAFNHRFWEGREPADINNQQPSDLLIGRGAIFSNTIGNLDENFDGAPLAGVNPDNFSTAYTGTITFPIAGEYRMVLAADDHAWVLLNGQVVSFDNDPHGTPNPNDAVSLATIDSITPFTVTAGETRTLFALHAEQGGGAAARLFWLRPGTTTWEIVPTTAQDGGGNTIDVLNSATNLPAAPTGLNVTNKTATVLTLNWTDAGPDEVRYSVQRATGSGAGLGQFTEIGLLPANATTFADSGLTTGATYTYRVVAENFIGIAQEELVVTMEASEPVPADPTNLSAFMLIHPGGVEPRNRLVFTDNAFNETGYFVERKLASEPDTAYAVIPGIPADGIVVNAPNATGEVFIDDRDPALVAGQVYSYRVRARNFENEFSAYATDTATADAGLRATIYDTMNFTGPAIVRRDGPINYDFGTGRINPTIGEDTFSVAWEGYFNAPTAGQYTFTFRTDDGARLFVDGVPVINDWVDRGPTDSVSAPITLTAGPHAISAHFFENGGGALAQLRVTGGGFNNVPVPLSVLTPADPNQALFAPAAVNTGRTIGECIQVSWLDTTWNETGFEVWRSANGGTAVKVADVPAQSTSYIDEAPAVAGTTYTYSVRAVNGAIQGPMSTVSSPGVATVAPGGLYQMGTNINPADWVTYAGAAARPVEFLDTDANSNPDKMRLVRAANDTWNSAYLVKPQKIDGFQTSWDFQFSTGTGTPADGYTFIIQTNPANAQGMPEGLGGGGGSLGYVGINNSVAIKFDIYPNINIVGLYLNGQDVTANGGDSPADPRNRDVTPFFDMIPGGGTGPVLHADMSYDPTTKTLKLTIDDINNPATAAFTGSWNVDLVAELDGFDCAWVGFTAATGGENAHHDIMNFTFDPTPPPSGEVFWTGGDGTGTDYNLAGNWSGPIPNGAEAAARFHGNDANAGAVNLGATAVTLGTISFDNTNSYTVSGGSITLNNGANPARIVVTNGSHSILSPITGGAITIERATTGGTLTLGKITASGPLTVPAGQQVILAPNGTNTGSVKIGAGSSIGTGASVDVMDNDMVIVGTPASAIQALVKAGVIKTTHAAPAGKTVGLAVAQGNDPTLAPSLAGQLSGQSFGPTDTLVKWTYHGDADLDGDVDPNDVAVWGVNFTGDLPAGTGTKTWTQGDWDGDGDVDPNDVALWGVNFTGDLPPGTGLSAAAPASAPLLAATPSTGTLANPVTPVTTPAPVKPALKPAVKPAAVPAVVTKPVARPAAKPVLKPAAKPAAKPVVKPATPAGKTSPVASIFSSTKIGSKGASTVLGSKAGGVLN